MLITIYIMFTAGTFNAQNLVVNGSFDDYYTCPDDVSQIDRVMGWSAIIGSPDYFNACSDTLVSDVPVNGRGFQQAYDGDGYVGCGTYASSFLVREPFQSQLAASMVPGQVYYLSMRVSPGGFGYIPSYTVGLASSGIGMRFSTVELDWSLDLLNNAPALHLSTILQDTAQWITLSGWYIPDSAYQFVQIGNFLTDALTQSVVIDPGAASDAAYAFVDDVCVSATPGVCAIAEGAPELASNGIGLVVTHEGGDIVLDWSGSVKVGEVEVMVVDAAGRAIWRSGAGRSGRATIQATLFSTGIHCVRAVSTDGTSLASKFMFLSP